MSVLTNIEETLAALFSSGPLATKIEQIAEVAFLKACESIAAQAKSGTLPDVLKPYAGILEFLAEAAEEVLKPKV